MKIFRYTYDYPEITSIVTDPDTGRLWIGHSDGLGNCYINCVFGQNPNQIFYSIERQANKIKDMFIDDGFLYVLYENGEYLLEKFSVSNPFTTTFTLDRPVGINQEPSAIFFRGNDLYILYPGTSLIPAKISKYDDSLDQVSEIELTGIENAISLTVDSSDEIWVVTETDPTNLIRVFEVTTNVYNFTIFEIN